MKPKKSENANLEKNRGMYFQLGLIISLSVSLAAFEWASPTLVDKSFHQPLKDEIAYEPDILDIKFQVEQKVQQKEVTQGSSLDTFKMVKETIKIPKKPFDSTLFTSIAITGDGGDEPDIDNIKYEGPSMPLKGFEVDKMPEFPGGFPALNKYLMDNTRVPQQVKEIKTTQKFQIKFVVDKTGQVTDIEFAGGKAIKSMQKEAMRVVNSLPKFEPGLKDGKPVSVIYYVPFNVVVQ